MTNRFKWRLTWHGRSDSKALRCAIMHCSTFPLFRDSKARLIDHEEYLALIQLEEIRPALSWWQIENKQVGLITLSAYTQYTSTWETISLCKSDFLAGYRVCQAHDRAIGHTLADAQTVKPNALRKTVAIALKALFTD